ncbi:hypothetical protein Ndes2437B_g00206 [Nannochloris sp. 'desiccata']
MARYGGAQPAISEDQLDVENNFSEEEEALYVAANDSEIDSDPQGKRRGQDLELSNVAVFRRAPAESPEADQHAFHPRPAAGWPSQAFIPQDDRTLILFDLNGVLVHHTFNGRTHKHFLRPGAEDLLRLVPHYRLGIYSSATQRTVQRAMAKLHEDLVSALPTGEKPPPGGFFEVVLCRDHCVLATEVGASRKGGKPWDTVKPLARYFEDLTQVVLVDDSPHKSLPEEAANMLVMPVWAGPETENGLTDAALPALVDGLLEALEAVQTTFQKKNVSSLTEDATLANKIPDIRPIVEQISKTLMILHPPITDDDEVEDEAEDSGLAMVNGLSLHPTRKSKPPPPPPPPSPPPGLPPPPHLLRSATHSGAAAASIGAKAIHHHAALYFLVLVKLKETPAIPGASLFDINTLLQRKSMAAYTTLFKRSAKAAVKTLVNAGTLIINENTSLSDSSNTGYYSGDRSTRYSLKREGVKLPSGDRLMEIEKYAQTLTPLSRINRRDKEQAATTTTTEAAGAGADNVLDTTTNSSASSEVLEKVELMMNDLVVSTIAELETRPGVSKESLDTALTSVFTPIPALQGWFGPHVGRDVNRKVMDCLRRVIQDALDAWCSSGDAEMVGMTGGGTPPSLFHVQITPDKGLKTVQNAVFDMAKLVEDASLDLAVVLQQRGVQFVPGGTVKLSTAKVVAKKVEEKAGGVLPVFEDRGTLTARAVPMGSEVALLHQQHQPNAAAAAATGAREKLTKQNEKKKLKDRLITELIYLNDDGVIDLTKDDEEIEIAAPLRKKRKNEANETHTATATRTTLDFVEGQTVTIKSGPYRGMQGRVKSATVTHLHVELDAQMKQVRVDRAHVAFQGYGMPMDAPGGHIPTSMGGGGGVPATTTTTAAAAAAPGGTEEVLTRGQQKLAAMRAKLGLPEDCGLTKAELKELVKEANREKQSNRAKEIQAAKAAKQRGAALMVPLPATILPSNSIEDAGPSGAGPADNNRNANASIKNRQLTPLHLEIAELARQATPTSSEVATVQAAVHAVDSAARGVWPAARAVLFGSQATGLALPGGDLDIVVLGVGPQLERAATGFTAGQRRVLGEHLEDLLDALRRSGTLLTSVQIIDAKIPIIKCLIQTSHAGPALPADISFGAVNGAAAVTFLRRQILAVPPLRPLSLAVKAFLRDRGLNEVFTGGIGSYAVVNMVLAHLQREGFQADITQADKLGLSRSSLLNSNNNNNNSIANKKVTIVDGRIILQSDQQRHQQLLQQQEKQMDQKQGAEEKPQRNGVDIEYDDKETFTYLGQLAAAGNGAATNNHNPSSLSSSSCLSSLSEDYDYGMLLWGFLERFSHEFDFLRQAISIRQGGFVKKGKWKQARKPWLLAVEDPQEPGKDICAGSFNIDYVRDEFAAAAQTLAEVSEDAEANLLAAGRGAGHSIHKQNSTLTDKMPMLSLLMDVRMRCRTYPCCQRCAKSFRASSRRSTTSNQEPIPKL